MQSPEASTAATPTQIHLALANFADEVVGTLARLFAYVGTLVLFAILGLAALGQPPEPARRRSGAEAGLERGRPLASGLRHQPAKFIR
ncbi:hypothetical protein ABIE85_006461 [Bradyrhizobium diazoefficiens]